MKKVVNKTINHFVKNVDTYNNAGSTWLIFTETKQWVIELTVKKTLWYNYNFFKNVFNYLGLEVVESQHYITEWVEETIINKVKRIDNSKGHLSRHNKIKNIIETNSTKSASVEETIENGVRSTISLKNPPYEQVENTIQNGVKEIELHKGVRPSAVKNIIENGVKLTNSSLQIDGSCVIEDVIENGVKKTCCHDMKLTKSVEKIIQNGVKNTYSDIVPREYDWSDEFDVEKVIENGVKETHDDVYHNKGRVDGVIRNGVKVVIPAFKMIYNPMNFEPVISEEKRITDVTDVIRDGIKEVQPLPAQDGNRDWGVYYYRKGEPTKPHTKYVDEVIENGIKEN